jgi:hypothetical protein
MTSGGDLLCRLLVELAGIRPEAAGCEPEFVPLRAEYQWHDGGRFAFGVSAARRHEIPVEDLLTPPPNAVFSPHEYPRAAQRFILPEAKIRSLRTTDSVAPASPASKAAPPQGLLAVNRSTQVEVLMVDRVPITWVVPGGEQLIASLRPGRYSISWRDFWGTRVGPSTVVQVPARVVDGVEADAGAPK